jgi:hypothetical protein
MSKIENEFGNLSRDSQDGAGFWVFEETCSLEPSLWWFENRSFSNYEVVMKIITFIGVAFVFCLTASAFADSNFDVLPATGASMEVADP